MKTVLAALVAALVAAVAPTAHADPSSDWVVVRANKRNPVSVMKGTPAQAARLRRQPGVLSVQPDALVRLEGQTSNDWYSDHQHHLENYNLGGLGAVDADIDATAAWTRTTGKGATIAVVDSCIDMDHADLAAVPKLAADLVHDDWDASCTPGGHWHGTHVAGTALASKDNTVGVAGVAPSASLIAMQVFDDDGVGTTSDILRAMAVAGYFRVDVVNLSLGSYATTDPGYGAVVRQYPQTLFVAAAGNDGTNNDVTPFWPANVDAPNLITVASSGRADEHVGSNYGPTTVDVHAAGYGVLATMPDDRYGWASGTSMAAPIVSGIAALLDAQAEASGATLRSRVMATAEPKGYPTLTGGRVNADLATR